MKIQSVSLVSNRNYGQNFGVSKRKSDENVSYETSPIRGKLIVPLAATILAMSPNNTTRASEPILVDMDNMEQVLESQPEKVVLKASFTNASSNGDTAMIELISDDGNDSDAEILNAIFVSKRRYGKQVNGERIIGERQVIESYRPNSIIKAKVYRIENGKEVYKYDTYYIEGNLNRTLMPMKAVNNPNLELDSMQRQKVQKVKKEISEEFYKFLEENFSDRLQKTMDKVVKEEDDDNLLDIIID